MTDSTQAPTRDHATHSPTLVPATMRSAFHERYGAPEDVVTVRTVPTPKPAAGEVLVKVRAASVNALDWHYVTGLPMFARPSLGLRRPKRQVPGADASGEVVAVGEGVTRHAIGDLVFSEVDGGGFAEYVIAPEDWWQPLPEGVSHEQATTLGRRRRDRPPGPARLGQPSRGPARPHRRSIGRSRQLRRATRQTPRRQPRHRGLQHPQRRRRPGRWRGPRRRLHP